MGGYALYFAECFYLPSVFGCLPSVFLAGTQRIRHFAECLFFAECFLVYTRQSICLPSG